MKRYKRKRANGDRLSKLYRRIDTDYLCKIFNVCKKTISRWIKNKVFDPTDIISISSFYMLRKEKKSNKNK